MATQLIEEAGLNNFRIETLCERLGYSRQNIYRYYANKRAILDAVIVEGARTLAIIIAEKLTDNEAPFDEQMIEGIMIACDIIRGDRQISSYSGKNLPFSAQLFMENADAVQQALLVFLEPTYIEAREKGEIYLNMSFRDITKWLFHVVLAELAFAHYESRESRKEFLLKMFSPSINAKKAQANATKDSVHPSHIR